MFFKLTKHCNIAERKKEIYKKNCLFRQFTDEPLCREM